MMMHIEDDQLQDYVDGTLGEDECAAVELHLSLCTACSATARELRALLQELSALAGGIEPERDLRPRIRAVIDAERVPVPPARTLWSARYLLAAAAVVLVTISSALTLLFVRVVPDDSVASSSWPDADAQFRVVEANYIAATDELERTLHALRGELAPETVRLLEDNLRIIDRALEEASAALRSDPGNQALSEMLVAAYEKKLDLLRRAAQPSPTRGGV